MTNPIHKHRKATATLANSLKKNEIYHWLVQHGYFPESYVLPPCFTVSKRPKRPKLFFQIKKNGKKYSVPRTECVDVHFPKSELTDRSFGLIHPEIHNDIAYHIANNWKTILRVLYHKDNQVTSYSFPVPIDAKNKGRIGFLRSGRMIYEFIGMVDADIASVCYRYTHIVRTDIKNFYPSLYTHSIPWAIHGKNRIRKSHNTHNYNLVGNRLDRLFQSANDGCTNGVSIGPVVSDVIAEVVASAVDRQFSKHIAALGIECEAVRFKDDYRILVKSESDGRKVIKALAKAMKEFNLQLSDEKTLIQLLPEGLFREWVSMYHAVHPRKQRKYSWKEFRELYLAVIRIDKTCHGTGVIDRFLADIVNKDGQLKVEVGVFNLQKVFSMLLMLAALRIKAFPKIIAIIEAIIHTQFGAIHEVEIVSYLEEYLKTLAEDEERNKYLVAWISYFFVSNNLVKHLSGKPKFKDAITRTVFNNRNAIFKDAKEFKLFEGSRSVGKRITMLEWLDVFDPPHPDA